MNPSMEIPEEVYEQTLDILVMNIRAELTIGLVMTALAILALVACHLTQRRMERDPIDRTGTLVGLFIGVVISASLLATGISLTAISYYRQALLDMAPRVAVIKYLSGR